MPYLVQILLPVYDNSGQRLPKEHYVKVRQSSRKRSVA